MASISSLDKRKLGQILEMGGGYVLDFTNRNFADLIRENCGVDIYNPKYARSGESKANRLREFWAVESDSVVGRVLFELIKHAQYLADVAGKPIPPAQAKAAVAISQRLLGKQPEATTEEDFLKEDFGDVKLAGLQLDPSIIPTLEARYNEARRCFTANAPLAVIFMCGSILEGALLGAAQRSPKNFNLASSSPKDESGKVKLFHLWKLAELIDVAATIGVLDPDVKKFSHALRDFRNYIHPYQQLATKFAPDEHTARICVQVLKAAIFDLSRKDAQ